MSKFQMSSKVRKRIEEKGLYAIVTAPKSPIPRICLILGLVILIVGSVYVFFGPPSNYPMDSDEFLNPALIFGIPGIFLFLNGILDFVMTSDSLKSRSEGMKLLEEHYGESAQIILKGIDDEVRAYPGDIPAGDLMAVKTAFKSGYFLSTWYIAPDLSRFIKLEDIVCVVGIMGAGTYIIPNHGDVVFEMFGANPNWGKLFGIIEKANPNVLHHDDVITFKGKRADIHSIFKPVTSSIPAHEQSKAVTKLRREIMDVIIDEYNNRIKNEAL